MAWSLPISPLLLGLFWSTASLSISTEGIHSATKHRGPAAGKGFKESQPEGLVSGVRVPQQTLADESFLIPGKISADESLKETSSNEAAAKRDLMIRVVTNRATTWEAHENGVLDNVDTEKFRSKLQKMFTGDVGPVTVAASQNKLYAALQVKILGAEGKTRDSKEWIKNAKAPNLYFRVSAEFPGFEEMVNELIPLEKKNSFHQKIIHREVSTIPEIMVDRQDKEKKIFKNVYLALDPIENFSDRRLTRAKNQVKELLSGTGETGDPFFRVDTNSPHVSLCYGDKISSHFAKEIAKIVEAEKGKKVAVQYELDALDTFSTKSKPTFNLAVKAKLIRAKDLEELLRGEGLRVPRLHFSLGAVNTEQFNKKYPDIALKFDGKTGRLDEEYKKELEHNYLPNTVLASGGNPFQVKEALGIDEEKENRLQAFEVDHVICYADDSIAGNYALTRPNLFKELLWAANNMSKLASKTSLMTFYNQYNAPKDKGLSLT